MRDLLKITLVFLLSIFISMLPDRPCENIPDDVFTFLDKVFIYGLLIITFLYISIMSIILFVDFIDWIINFSSDCSFYKYLKNEHNMQITYFINIGAIVLLLLLLFLLAIIVHFYPK